MKVQIDCIPCQVKQCIATARKLTDDEKLISRTLKESLDIASEFEAHKNVFSLYYAMQKNAKKINPGRDPYKEFKKMFNEICLNIAPDLNKIAYDSENIFETALRISLAGNAIDVMQGHILNEEYLIQSVKNSFAQSLKKDDINFLKENILNAKKILFIGDNAGEIVFDKIFIEVLRDKILKSSDSDKITYCVRGGPSLNDSTLEDAKMTGMDKLVKVITTGVDLPAAYLPACSKEFNEEYDSSDLIISKGQGNFEALFDEKKNIFFLLKIKCETILTLINGRYELGEVVVEHAKI